MRILTLLPSLSPSFSWLKRGSASPSPLPSCGSNEFYFSVLFIRQIVLQQNMYFERDPTKTEELAKTLDIDGLPFVGARIKPNEAYYW